MGTHYLSEECEVLERDTYVKLMRCVATVGSFGQRSLARDGLTPRQFGVLKSLCHLGLINQKGHWTDAAPERGEHHLHGLQPRAAWSG